ncbi:hypothetical protein L2E82_27013 [Cichorium intybus]|uniref:Uncharacterized protein n=1 Tax=Cichorium intybus TaxID=13427 RepID=A0ACB9CRX8_CICIN|nr:hypothetical protein L2E82_27013 [Cichorium intybus]
MSCFWGCNTIGERWNFIVNGPITRIDVVSAQEGIIGISFEWVSDQGKRTFSVGKVLGLGQLLNILINSPSEYLTSLGGSFKNREDGGKDIMSLSFETNCKNYIPIGTISDPSFSFQGKGFVIVGFYGYLDSTVTPYDIGILVQQKSKVLYLANKQGSSLLVNKRPSPWGVSCGWPFDHGVFNNIKSIEIPVGKTKVIKCIKFEYLDKDDEVVSSPVHGGVKKDDTIELFVSNDKDMISLPPSSRFLKDPPSETTLEQGKNNKQYMPDLNVTEQT